MRLVGGEGGREWANFEGDGLGKGLHTPLIPCLPSSVYLFFPIACHHLTYLSTIMSIFTDLYAARPICSLCCSPFSPVNPCLQLSCYHLYCQQCVQEMTQAGGYVCPFDQTYSEVTVYNQQYIDSVENVLANPASYISPGQLPGLTALLSTFQASINYSQVPCRLYFQTWNCSYVQRYCPYDHCQSVLGGKGCPLAGNCYRGKNCPYGHQGGGVGRGGKGVMPGFCFHRFPKWFNAQPNNGYTAITLPPSKRRYQEIAGLFIHSSPHQTILRIDRIQNKQLYTTYANKHESASAIEGKSVKITRLFHGTGSTPPTTICSSGFYYQSYGLFGPGFYFSHNSAYIAHHSAHRLPDGSLQVVCCNVVVGVGRQGGGGEGGKGGTAETGGKVP